MFVIPREYDSIKSNLKEKNPSWSDDKISESAAKIFYSIYKVTVQEAIKMEKEGKWESYKKKISKKEFSTEEIFSYTSYGEKGLEVKEIEGEYYIDAVISTPDLDLVNDVVSERALNQMVEQILTSPMANKAGVFHDRKSIPIGKAVEAKSLSNGSVWVRTKLNKAIKHSNPGLWETFIKSIENGFLDATSIEYKAKKYYNKFIGNTVARVIDDIILLGYTFTGRPANPNAKIEGFFVKSFDVIDDNNTSLKNVENLDEVNLVEQEEKIKTEIKEEPVKEEPKVEEPKAEEEKTEEPVKESEEKPEEVKKEEPKEETGEKVEVEKKEFDLMKQKLAEFEKKEADNKKIIELKELGVLKERIAKLEAQSKILVEKKEEEKKEKTYEEEMKEYKENPSWEKAKKLGKKYLYK